MRVLFQTRPGYKERASGTDIELLNTMIDLKKLGIEVVISDKQNIPLKYYDIIHIVDCTKISEAYGFFNNAMKQKKKIVVSPVFIDMHELYKDEPEKLAAWRAQNILRREIMQDADMLILKSKEEEATIRNILFVDRPSVVIHSGKQILSVYKAVLNEDKVINKNYYYSQTYNISKYWK